MLRAVRGVEYKRARKDERRIEMSVGLARFPFVRDLDGFDFAAQPSIDKKQILELMAGRFIANAEVVGNELIIVQRILRVTMPLPSDSHA